MSDPRTRRLSLTSSLLPRPTTSRSPRRCDDTGVVVSEATSRKLPQAKALAPEPLPISTSRISLINSIHKLKKRAKALGQDAKKVDLTL
jgi:hypothetical protein